MPLLRPSPASSVAASQDDRAAPLFGENFLETLEYLHIVARKILSGQMKAERRSRTKGVSVEFADHRPYSPGDDFRFIVPYVEFRKQTRGARPVLLDTNVLIDGRIAEIMETGVIESELLVPQFVVRELRTLADSADKLKRVRGKHGQEMLQKLIDNPKINCRIYDSNARGDRGITDVDDRLLLLAIELNAKVMTTDAPLAQEARVKNVDVINLNELAMKLKPRVMPGERIFLEITKAGEAPGQGVGHLSDGTMVVVEDGRSFLNQDVEVVVTNTIQTSAGKMIFGRIDNQRRAAE